MDESHKKSKNIFLIYAIGISLSIFFIVLVRAATSAITWDEAYTYVVYAKDFGIKQLIDIHSNYANNHIINTIMIFIADKLCGLQYNEFVIRLPNIIMLIFYFIGSYNLVKDEKHKYLSFSGLVLNYYVMEFFGLARGYGIAATFIVWMCYFFKKASDKNYDDKNILISVMFGLFACYANTVSILALGTIGVIYLIKLIMKKDIIGFIKRNVIKIIPMIVFFIYILIFHFIVTGSDKPVFGENGGMTIIGFLQHSFVWMFIENPIINLIISSIGLLMIIVSVIIYRKQIKEKPFFAAMIILGLLLIIPSTVLHKPYLLERCLIPLWPIFVMGIIEMYGLYADKLSANINTILTVIIILFLMFVFARRINVKSTRTWNDNYIVRDIVYNALYEQRTLTKEEYEEIKKFYGITFYSEKILQQYGFDIIPKE